MVSKKQKGITLLSLVITVIILLILSSVGISLLSGDNGILNMASKVKIENVLGALKEEIKLEKTEKMFDGKNITLEDLLAQGKIKRSLKKKDDGNYYMYYTIKENAYKNMNGLGKGNVVDLRDIFLIDDNLNIKYIGKENKEYGEKIEEKILKDETKIRFANKSFEKYVSKISGVKEENMQFKWMKNQTSLRIADKEVDNLEDLVFFPNLESLSIGEYGKNIPPITKLDGIENCKKLKRLFVTYGPDKDYSKIKELPNLIYFSRYSGNDFKNIFKNVSLNKNIMTLIVSGQSIKNLKEIKDLIHIKNLGLGGNEIESMKGIENLKNLVGIDLSYNNINKIEGLEKLENLKDIFLSNNQIQDITPLYLNKGLMTIDLRGNQGIKGNIEEYTNEEKEKILKIGNILDKKDGVIKVDSDKLGLFNNYKKIFLGDQNLENIDFLKNQTKLIELDLYNNKINDIQILNDFKQLKILNLAGIDNNVKLKHIEDIISNLDILKLNDESLKSILECDVNKITKLSLGQSNLENFPDISKFYKLNNLSIISNPKIKDFSNISKLKNLKVLRLNYNNLRGRMIDFSNLNNLTKIELDGNYLWTEDLENLKVFKNNKNMEIYLKNNSIIDATSLLELDPTTKIDLRGNINLTKESKEKLKLRFANNVRF